MTSKHTPGPWVYKPATDKMHAVMAMGGNIVIFKVAPDDADARLMAAGPDLLGLHEADMVDLDLLAKAIHAGDPMPELVIRVTDMLNRKRAAIAKATGEQP